MRKRGKPISRRLAQPVLLIGGIEWRWIHAEKGETGIPKYVPIGFGRKFAAKLESIVDKAADNFGAAARRRYDKSLAKKRSRALKRKSE